MGISTIIALKALLRAVGHKKNELIISPSLRQSKHVMDYINTFYKQLSDHVDMKISEETQTSMMFEDGGEIYSLPNSPDTIRGYKADDIYIDEFAHFTNNTDKQIIEAVAPSTIRGDSIWYISTPFGDQNLYYDYWHDNKNKNIKKITLNWRECPDLTQEKIDDNRQRLGEDAFLQEFENQFPPDFENQEFPTELIKSCIDPELVYTDLIQTNNNYYAGADIGRKTDLTAFSVFEKTENKYRLVFKKTMKNTPYNEQKIFFQYMLDNYHFEKFHIDETGIGNMFAEELHRTYGHITPITFNNENKQSMVANVKRLMQNKQLEYPDDPLIFDNFKSIQRIYTSSNYLRFDSVHDSEIGHADLFWSIALALYDESKNRGFVLPHSFDFSKPREQTIPFV